MYKPSIAPCPYSYNVYRNNVQFLLDAHALLQSQFNPTAIMFSAGPTVIKLFESEDVLKSKTRNSNY